MVVQSVRPCIQVLRLAMFVTQRFCVLSRWMPEWGFLPALFGCLARAVGMLAASQSSPAVGFQQASEVTMQTQWFILIGGTVLSPHPLYSVKSAHWLNVQSSSYALLPADMNCGGSFSSSLKKARKDQVEFLLNKPPHKTSGTHPCLPDVPLTGSHRIFYYASSWCLSCMSDSNCS